MIEIGENLFTLAMILGLSAIGAGLLAWFGYLGNRK